MTAEIAIINRSAVTLATDSAVTLSVRGKEKIYNSADKLFELSAKDPVGIMIYNNLEFMGITLEIAIKQFRGLSNSYKTIQEYADAFFKYLTEDLKPTEDIELDHAKSILKPELKRLLDIFDRRASASFNKFKKKTDFSAIFKSLTQEQIKNLEKLDRVACFEASEDQKLLSLYSEMFKEVVADIFDQLPLSEEHKNLLNQLCFFNPY